MLTETKIYRDGTQATGIAPLPDQSPHEQSFVDMMDDVLDSLRRGRVALEWSGQLEQAEKIANSMDKVRAAIEYFRLKSYNHAQSATTERKLVATPDHNGALVPASPVDMQVYDKITAGYWTERKGEPAVTITFGDSGVIRRAVLHDERLKGQHVTLYTSPQVPEDTARLDWIERQHLEELTMGLAIDCEHDGQYYVCGDSNKTGYGDSLREAIDAARKGE